MIAFGQHQLELFFGIRIEVHQLRRLGLHLHRMQQLAIHPKAHFHRRGISRTLAGQANADHIFGIPIHPMRSLDGAAVDPPHSFIFRVIFRFDRTRRQWIATDRPRRDALSRTQILIHQHRRDRQHIANIVEPVAGIVAGEITLRVEVHRQQVADRIGILVAIQSPGSHAAGVGLDARIRPVELSGQKAEESIKIRLRHSRQPFGRHLPIAYLLDDPVPSIAAFHQGRRSTKWSEVQVSRGHPVVVATGAIARKNGLNRLVEAAGRLGCGEG